MHAGGSHASRALSLGMGAVRGVESDGGTAETGPVISRFAGGPRSSCGFHRTPPLRLSSLVNDFVDIVRSSLSFSPARGDGTALRVHILCLQVSVTRVGGDMNVWSMRLAAM